jgi:hypothetical protein
MNTLCKAVLTDRKKEFLKTRLDGVDDQTLGHNQFPAIFLQFSVHDDFCHLLRMYLVDNGKQQPIVRDKASQT